MSAPAATRWPRAILHVDMDAFYVAVETRRDPGLRGRPVVVGGTGRRGVVASASYEARAYGVRSAMPTAVARRLCPQLLFLPGDHELYGRASQRVMALFGRYTPLVEPLSLDEAFLDVTGAQRRVGAPEEMAALIRRAVLDEEGLPCSVGVAPTKFLAKLASVAAKPRPSPDGPRAGAGVCVVLPGAELAFLHPLPLTALWGVGPVTLRRIVRLGVSTVGELAALPVETVAIAVGDAVGRHLHALAHGRDDRPVEPVRAAKSIGHEETFAHDRFERDELEVELVRLADAVAARLRRAGLAGRTVTLKLRYGDFRTLTRSHTGRAVLDGGADIAREAKALLAGLDVAPGIRLIGISVGGLAPVESRQLRLDLERRSDGSPDRGRPSGWVDADRAVDAIRARFGTAAIGPGMRVLRPGAQQWGPNDLATGPDPPRSAPGTDPSEPGADR